MKRDIEDRLIKFSVRIYKLNEKIHKTGFSTYLSNQILRSVTSSTLNYGEAQGAESARDYLHKTGVVIKELRETRVNLRLMKESEIIDEIEELEGILSEADELIAILYTAMKTARSRINL